MYENHECDICNKRFDDERDILVAWYESSSYVTLVHNECLVKLDGEHSVPLRDITGDNNLVTRIRMLKRYDDNPVLHTKLKHLFKRLGLTYNKTMKIF